VRVGLERVLAPIEHLSDGKQRLSRLAINWLREMGS
jgi:hypothetical protein